jgi:hypothetical protein
VNRYRTKGKQNGKKKNTTKRNTKRKKTEQEKTGGKMKQETDN